MRHERHIGRRFPFYLVAILVGMSGILFSRQLDDTALRLLVVMVSVSIPLFASGNMLARPGVGRLQRALLFLGAMMLLAGAGVSVSGLADSLLEDEMFPPAVVNFSRTLGMLSLMLGLFTVLYSTVRTGEDIEEMADRFWHLAEHISDGFILSSAAGKILLVNKQVLDLFRKTDEEVIGRDTTALAREFEMGAVLEHFERRSGGLASQYELDCKIGGEDRRLWISGSPIFDHHGRHTGTIGLVRDVTEQHRLSLRLEQYNRGLKQLVEEQTQRLRESETRFRNLLVSMNEGFITLDSRYRIHFANERICRLLQVKAEDLSGREVFDFIDAAGRVHLLNLLAQGAGHEGDDLRREMNLVDTQGSLVPVVVGVSYLSGATGHDTRYSLVMTSVAELKRMQHQLEQRARDLEKANEELRLHDRAKDSFLSNVSHELRTPLSTIKGYLEMLESGGLGEMDSSQSSALAVMHRNVDRLVGHINEIIEFSRMEIRGVQLSMSLFDPHKLAAEGIASAQPQTLSKDISLNLFVDEGMGPAWGDADKLGQVLGILLNNAVKFSNTGGMVQVRVQRSDGRALVIAVSDTGIGIAPGFHERVFNKFFQVDASRSRRYGGTGIGLSIAKSIVEAHGGHMELDSAPDRGSTFSVVLPGAIFDASVPPEAASGMEDFHVVLITACDTFKSGITAVLGKTGCRVSSYAHHFEGARGAIEQQASLVILNDSAVDEGSEATITTLRAHREGEQLPIIVCSDHDSERIRDAAALFQDVYFLEKPFSARRLLAYMRAACFGERLLLETEPGQESAAAPEGLRVLIVDADPSLLEWLELALGRRDIACWCASSVEQAVEIAEKEPPDVVLLDADLPGTFAEERVARLREKGVMGSAPIYVMTGAPGASVPGGNGHGAAGVLRKPFEVGDVMAILRSVPPRVRAADGRAHPAS